MTNLMMKNFFELNSEQIMATRRCLFLRLIARRRHRKNRKLGK